ncbi:magnesium transporter [Thalassomonas haliotis]|uniref:Magnesium transporter n=1 Tax=Thalassomonas haliotis TaxID=485448 RepID=A0ABY7V8Q0_9GAMM|nr:magnesium transporter [Thalassomonas haliotis]WDE09696.1 magnesium transporter [Thalassomonas haliotis]
MITSDERQQLIKWIQSHIEQEELALPIQAEQFLPADWAFTLEATPYASKKAMWQLIPEAQKSETLAVLREESRHELFKAVGKKELISVALESSNEQVVSVLGELSRPVIQKAIEELPKKDRAVIKDALEYDASLVGRYASRSQQPLLSGTSIGEARDLLVDQPSIEAIYLVDERGYYQGKVMLHQLCYCDKGQSLLEVALGKDEVVLASEKVDNLGSIFKRVQATELAVVDENNEYIGTFHLRDVMGHVEAFYEAKIAHVGNVSDEDLFAPVISSARQRAVWLGINLLTALLAAWVIGQFEATLAEIVALAVLMPIVASMGGIAGSQTLTLTIRGLATGQLSNINIRLLRDKEFKVSVINAVIWALSVGTIAYFWFGSPGITLVIFVAVLVNMTVAVMAGIGIPYAMHKMKIDPALAGSVILTTVSDVVGFFIFLGGATWVLLD